MIADTCTNDNKINRQSLLSRKYELIENADECSKIVEEILINQKIIAIDCEGVFLSREGKLTLIQISLQDESVFIFDILKGGEEMFAGYNGSKGLKSILENKKILKLIHDCRNDWDSLLYQYSVRLYNFVDTQEAFFVFKLFHFHEITLPISLMNFIENMLKIKLKYKEKFKNDINCDPYLWERRPIEDSNLNYAAEDVVHLIKAWIELREKFNANMKEIVYFLTILKVVDVNMFHQFGEYLTTNIIYFNMFDNVSDSKEMLNYIFSIDYIYNFLQIKIICNENTDNTLTSNEDSYGSPKNRLEENPKNKNLDTNKNKFFFDDEYKNMFKSHDNSISLVKLGMDYKKKQKISCLKSFDWIIQESLWSKSFQKKQNYSYSELIKDLDVFKSSETKSDKLTRKKFNKFTHAKKEEKEEKEAKSTNSSNKANNINARSRFNKNKRTKGINNNNIKFNNIDLDNRNHNQHRVENLIDLRNTKVEGNKNTSRSDSIENLKPIITNFYSKGITNHKDFSKSEENKSYSINRSNESTIKVNSKSYAHPRKLSFNTDSIKKLSNFSSISQNFISDSDKNSTLIGNEYELSADESERDSNTGIYYSTNEKSIKNKKNRKLCFSQEKRNSSKHLTLFENSKIKIANDEIAKRKTHRSDNAIQDFTSIFCKFDKKEENKSNKSEESVNQIENKIDNKFISPNKENEKLKNVINIENLFDFNQNKFNQSLYDTVNFETKKPSNTSGDNNIDNIWSYNHQTSSNKSNNKHYTSYKQRNFFKSHYSYYNKNNNSNPYNYRYNSYYGFNNKANYNNNYYYDSNYYKTNINKFINNNQSQFADCQRDHLNKENEDPKDLANYLADVAKDIHSSNDISNLNANIKQRKTWDISDKNTEEKELFLKDIDQIQEKIDLERKVSSVENKKASNEKNSNLDKIIVNLNSENYNTNFNKKEKCFLQNNKKNNNENINYYYPNYYNYANSYKKTYNKNGNNKYYFKNAKKNNDNFNDVSKKHNCANENYSAADSIQDEINFDYHKQQEFDKEKKKNFNNYELENENVKNSICNVIENININNSFNINIDKETFNLKKIVFKDSKENESNSNFTSASSKKVVYFEYENDSCINKKNANNVVVENLCYEASNISEKIDINIDIKNNSIADSNNKTHNTNINNFFNIYLPKAKGDNKNFSMEIKINKAENNNNYEYFYFNNYNQNKKQQKTKSNIFYNYNKNYKKNYKSKKDLIMNEEEIKKNINIDNYNINNNIIENEDINMI